MIRVYNFVTILPYALNDMRTIIINGIFNKNILIKIENM